MKHSVLLDTEERIVPGAEENTTRLLKLRPKRDATERVARWSAKANLLGTAGLCALLSWASYLGMPEGRAISSADRVARLVVWFLTPFVGAVLLGASLWLVVYSIQFARGRAPSASSLTAEVFRAARLITGVAGAFVVWYVVTRALDRS